ncbi:MAG: hypothetical protein ABIQ60_05755 [Burkholderiaceae bacterium]
MPPDAAGGRDWGARLPFQVEFGPYSLAVEFRQRSNMYDRRRLACVNLEEHRIELRQDLDGMRLIEAFLSCLIRLCHFSKGCQQGCVEETYTHSFATGIVEFAVRNPHAWLWFNLLLSEHLPGRVHYDRVVRAAVARSPEMPKRVLVAGRPVTLRTLTKGQTGNAFGWYDYDRREVQLYAGLSGANLPVVALHELTHAVHHAYGLGPRDKHRRYLRAQLDGWLGIMRDNPSAWRWLVWTIRSSQAPGEHGSARMARSRST